MLEKILQSNQNYLQFKNSFHFYFQIITVTFFSWKFLNICVEVTQEVASRGLVFVYEYGSADMKVIEISAKFH